MYNKILKVAVFVFEVDILLAAICCTPDQWQGTLYLDYGTVFIDKSRNIPNTAYSYINGTIKAAYDYTNKRTYMKLHGTEVSPLIPKPVPYDTTYINDYKKKIQYQMGPDGSCQKSALFSMTKQCVPDDADLVSSGSFGGLSFMKVKNYRFTLHGDINYAVDATVNFDFSPETCNPLRAVYFVGSSEAGSGTLYNLDAFDIIPEIRDPTVFNPPPQCL